MNISGESIVSYYAMRVKPNRLYGDEKVELRNNIINGDWMSEDVRQELFELYVKGVRQKHFLYTDEMMCIHVKHRGFIKPISKDMVEYNNGKLQSIWGKFIKYPLFRVQEGMEDDNLKHDEIGYKHLLKHYEELMGHKHYLSTRYGSQYGGQHLEGLTRYRAKEIIEKEGLDESLVEENRLKTLQRDYWFYEVEDILDLIKSNYKEYWMRDFYKRLGNMNRPMIEIVNSQYQ